MPLLIGLFALYAVAVTWQMRRALRAAGLVRRRREAQRLLLLVSLGAPLLVALIFAAG